MLKAPTIRRSVLVVSYEPDTRVRHRSEDAERCFSEVVKAQARYTNAPDTAPPEYARLTLKQGGKSLALSNVRAQLQLTFDESGVPIERTYQAAVKNARAAYEGVKRFQPPEKLLEMGFVVEFNLAGNENPREIAEEIGPKYFAGPTLGRWAGFEGRFGFATDDELFANLQLSIYEIRGGEVSGGQRTVNIGALNVVERGLAVSVDINNKLRRTSGKAMSEDDFEAVFRKMDWMLAGEYLKLFPGGEAT